MFRKRKFVLRRLLHSRKRRIFSISLLAAVFLAALPLTVYAAASGVSFETAAEYGAGDEPQSVAVGDFNGDGKPDLAVPNKNSDNVSILLGMGDGAFLPAVNYDAGDGPSGVAVGDFNGDGKLDLAVTNYSSDDVSVLLGEGDGAFLPAVNYGVGSRPQGVAVGDFNGDNNPDLAVANSFINCVSVLLGEGDGAFLPAANFIVGFSPISVAVGDFNGDGKSDLVTANLSGGNVSVLLGDGNGAFETAVNYSARFQANGVAVGDFNGDGKEDLAVCSLVSGDNLSVLLGTGDGAFLPAVNYDAGDMPVGVAVGDFDGDGNLDLAVVNSLGNDVSIFLGNGDGTFQKVGDYGAGRGSRSVAVDDFNGDGKGDLAVANQYGDNVSVLLGTGDGAFGARVDYRAGDEPYGIAIGDFNGDNNPDLAVANHNSNNVSVLLGNGEGAFQKAGDYNTGIRPRSVAAGDFNRDGKVDLAVANDYSDNVSVLLGNGDGVFQPAEHYSVGSALYAVPYSVAVGDFNGDGNPDLAVANRNHNNVTVLLGRGDDAFQAGEPYGVGDRPYCVVVGDFNGDSKEDLAVANYSSNNVSVLFGAGDGSFLAAVDYGAGINPCCLVVGDFNGDGALDLATANYTGKNVSVLLGNGDGTFQPAVNTDVGFRVQNVAVGDLNGDGKADLALTLYDSEMGEYVSILLGKGDGAFRDQVNYGVGREPQGVAVGDFDGDGKPDLAVTNGLSDNVSVLLNRSPLFGVPDEGDGTPGGGDGGNGGDIDSGGSGGGGDSGGGGSSNGGDGDSGGGGSSNGGGGSSGGGGTGATTTTNNNGTPPAPPTYETTLSGVMGSETTLPIGVDADTGAGRIDVGDLAKDLFASGKGAVLTIPSIPGVSSFTLGIPADSLAGGQGEGAVTFATEVGSITIPSDMLAGIANTEGTQVGITIGQGDKSGLPEDVRAAIGDRPMVQLTFTLDGKEAEWNNPAAPVTVAIPYTPTAEELADPEHIVVWYIDGRGNVIAVPDGRYDLATGTVVFTTSHFSHYAVAYVHKTFGDLGSVEWARKPVEVMASKGIIHGTGKDAFSPDANITRADYLVLLVKTLGLTAKFEDNFADVTPGDYYYEALGIAKKLGIASGSGDNRFNPTERISRQDMMALTARALEKFGGWKAGNSKGALDPFSDRGEIADYAVKSLAALVQEGLVAGSENKLNPRANTTRAEAAVFLYKIYNRSQR